AGRGLHVNIAGEPGALKGARPVRTGGRRKRTCATGTSPAAYRCLRREAPCCIPGLAGRNLEDIPGSDGLLKIRKVKGTTAWCAARRFTVFPVQQGGTWRDVPGSDALPGAERLREQHHGSQPVIVSRRMERCAGGPARHGES